MSGNVATLVVWLLGYAVLVLGVGLVAARHASRSPEEFFLAGRRLGTVVLFMALFGTNCTAFVLMGIPGQSYHDGIGIFSVNAPIVALGIPLTFYLIGSPARRMARRLGALTPAELYAKRFGSRWIGVLLFAVFAIYTLPYMVVAVKGSALALEVISGGTIPGWVGALFVTLLTVVYTSAGGMRSTAWTNVLQGFVFLSFMVAAFFLISSSMGGLSSAMEAVRETDADLLRVAHGRFFGPKAWTSWGLVISLTVVAFPHMFARLMAARDETALKNVCRLYPLALVALWVPAVLIGVWGAAAFPDLVGQESDRIYALMSAEHLPAWMGPASVVVVLAACMSTLDAQILTLSSMLVRDVIDPFLEHDRQDDDVREGRIFGVLIAAAVFGLALVWGESLFDIASIAFSGYVTLTPALFLGVRWRRATRAGIVASIVAGNLVLGLGLTGHWPLYGFLPVAWAFVAACFAGWVVSLATRADDPALLERAFAD